MARWTSRLAWYGVLVLASWGTRPAWGLDAGEIAHAWAAHEQSTEFRAVGTLDERQTDGNLVTVGFEMRRRSGHEYLKLSRGPAFYCGLAMNDRGTSAAMAVPAENRLYQFADRSRGGRAHRFGVLDYTVRTGEAVALDDDSVAGRSCYHLQLTTKDRRTIHEAWIDKAEFVALRWITKYKGRIWRSISFDNVNFQPELTDADLDVAAPDGAKVINIGQGQRPEPVRFGSAGELRRRTGLRALTPHWLPEGFRLTGIGLASPFPMNPFRRRVMQFCQNGEQLIFLGMGANPPRSERETGDPEPPGEPTEVKANTFFWVRYDVRLALVGPRDMASAELRHVAESVDWYDR